MSPRLDEAAAQSLLFRRAERRLLGNGIDYCLNGFCWLLKNPKVVACFFFPKKLLLI